MMIDFWMSAAGHLVFTVAWLFVCFWVGFFMHRIFSGAPWYFYVAFVALLIVGSEMFSHYWHYWLMP